MVTIKPPSGSQPIQQPSQVSGAKQAPGQQGGAQATGAQLPVVNPEAVANALKKYQALRKKLKQPFLSGAAGLFADSVVFPSELLDPNDPANDPKYLHLLFAVFGLKELERYFATPEQLEEREEEETEEKKSPKNKKTKKVKKGGSNSLRKK